MQVRRQEIVTKDEGFTVAVKEKVAKKKVKALSITVDHPDIANNDYDQSDTMAQLDTMTMSNIDSNKMSWATKVPRKVAKEHLARELPEVQRELQQIAEKEAKEIREMYILKALELTRLLIIIFTAPRGDQVVIHIPSWGFQAWCINYGWNNKNQYFCTWHCNFDTYIYNVFKDFLLMIYMPGCHIEFESWKDLQLIHSIKNDTQDSEVKEIHMFVSSSDLQLHGLGGPHQHDLASLSGPLPNFTTNSNTFLSLAINTSIVPNASKAHTNLLSVSVPENLVSSASPNLLIISEASIRTFSTFSLGKEIHLQWIGSSSWVDI
ncbi:hypothetical protein EDD18DRAFT_1106226 [Armillaria luteobubalina]|uniref:Uncharacterized protein n=1 Tax=Armillaria luteobubalina TaxID=153913 RepID=A0AA39TN70_9AGAR|nr:hypothetical protein EDD18DRAFT_1106226 [Armillaria luteobubalina]